MKQSFELTNFATEPRKMNHRPNPMLVVLCWELRRLAANRANRFLVLAVFLLFCFLCWVGRVPAANTYGYGTTTATMRVNIGTNWGLAYSLALPMLGLFGLLVPFISAESSGLDLKRRTHEIVMATAIPNRAYLWGRFLAGLLTSLALSVIMLLAIFVTPSLIGYSVPDLPFLLMLWALMAFPAIILLSGLSFFLATWQPRSAGLIKVGLVIAWIVGAFLLTTANPFNTHWQDGYEVIDRDSPAVVGLFDPTSYLMSQVIVQRYDNAFFHQLFGENPITPKDPTQEQVDRAFQLVNQNIPDLTPWLLPHLALVLAGLLMVPLAGLVFTRFNNTLK